jgi:hypothetical protein
MSDTINFKAFYKDICIDFRKIRREKFRVPEKDVEMDFIENW